MAKAKQAEAEEQAREAEPTPKAPTPASVPAERVTESETSTSTPAPAEKLLGNGKTPSASNLSDTGSVNSNGAAGVPPAAPTGQSSFSPCQFSRRVLNTAAECP